MTKKIFRSIMLAVTAVLLAGMVIMLAFLYDYFYGIQKRQMGDMLDIAAVSVEEDGADYLRQISPDRYRLTWIGADGTVLYDTEAGAEAMANHADRTEFRQAVESGVGEVSRYSTTLMQRTTYRAKHLADGTVLRISASYASVWLLVIGMLQPLAVVLLVALLVASLLARRLSRRIVEPLNGLNLEQPLENETYEELSPLLTRINQQRRQIAFQMRTLQQKTDEFAQITASMKEGLVLLDGKGTVLSINPAACRVFGTDAGAMGQDFLTIDRSREMSHAVETARQTGHSELRTVCGGRDYQMDISRIESEGDSIGCVILAFDMTEQANAERSRREFTANVSHELKTPLQGIIGSAELIENGMVKPEDMPRFVGHIHQEASRLVTLIGDIIRLSQLDEGAEMPMETVDLLAVAGEVRRDLTDAAAARKITVTVDGGGAVVTGVRRLLYEMLFNLCDNAIRYNRDGGSVAVTVTAEGDHAVLAVRDTGVGIAPEHQSRVFERFYRVDKSHSKASGGTGLGLSIVKHAVAYHHGTIALESRLGEGTEIRVTLPLKQ